MEGWQWAIVLKPVLLLALFIPGALLVYWVRPKMKNSWLKRLLFFSWRV